MTTRADADAPAETSSIAPADYAAFIGQIELARIWLQAATMRNHHGPETPERATIAVEGDARWEPLPTGFRALQTYRLLFQAGDDDLADVEATFGLEYDSREPMTDQIFAVFCDVNLPVNVWPYLREFVSAAVGRMGWLTVTLPTLKVGTRPGPRRAEALAGDERAPSVPVRARRGRTPAPRKRSTGARRDPT